MFATFRDTLPVRQPWNQSKKTFDSMACLTVSVPLKVANIFKHPVVFLENNLSQVFGDTGGGGGGYRNLTVFLHFLHLLKNTR